MLNDTLTAKQASLLHRAGYGMFRPMGDKATSWCEDLADRGLLLRGEDRIFALTEQGAFALQQYEIQTRG